MTYEQTEMNELVNGADGDLNAVISEYEVLEAQYVAAYSFGGILPATSNTSSFPMSTTSASSTTP
jgi:hypothetical protein